MAEEIVYDGNWVKPEHLERELRAGDLVMVQAKNYVYVEQVNDIDWKGRIVIATESGILSFAGQYVICVRLAK